ncbi:Acetyltransferase (GNAT) domain-containing protein [Sulfobacillus thermosulfidooxidans DSM 9293]|uniref:Acetyltransferase (GNAT) domain-containing protein n=1 Tax=Sulfobacillus thermosulfidooxidans (strain DSM 9293 / VKM B-1269 / AT-1) TaxID=929705 RepID=A0A1W1WPS4_SULTA|nr:GNAT family N-acetyltransferase [Sulfobacillus thermosulfidooxidans]SMC08215.1 Acetyltransferase (GNAT) domain-containing protein [Sulfobacillus thermosulfidooxidans DSM 9293]
MDAIRIVEHEADTIENSAIRELWHSARLPSPSGSCQPKWFIMTTHHNRGVGVIGVERYGSAALLRSLVVAPEFRGQGLGSHLVWHALNHLQAENTRMVCLVTETAEKFFRQWHFTVTSWEKVPESMWSVPYGAKASANGYYSLESNGHVNMNSINWS